MAAKTKQKAPKVAELKTAVQNQAVDNYRMVAAFLKNFADFASTQPQIHPEVVKSATLVRVFLENEVRAAEKKTCVSKTKKA